MPSNKRLNAISALLAAAVIGWSKALGQPERAIEGRQENTDDNDPTKTRLQTYSGLIRDLRQDHLLGTGSLFKAYCPHIYQPDVESITVEYISNLFFNTPITLNSGFFHLYKLGNHSKDLHQPLSPVLFPNGQKADDIVARLDSIDEKALTGLSSEILNKLSSLPHIRPFEYKPSGSGDIDLLRTVLEQNQKAFQRELLGEVHSVRDDVKKLQASVDKFHEEQLLALPRQANLITGRSELAEIIRDAVREGTKAGFLEGLRQQKEDETRATTLVLDTTKDAMKDLFKDKQKEIIGKVVSRAAKYFSKQILPTLWEVAKQCFM